MLSKNDYHKSSYEQRIAFRVAYQFYATLQILAHSSAICEASSSSLSRIDAPSHQSMLFARERNLTIRPFE